MAESARLAEDLLYSEPVTHDHDQAPRTIAAAQAWATLAVAEALNRLADAVDALHP